MAVIGRRALLALFAYGVLQARARHDALQAINTVATALSDGDASGAMAPFDNSSTNYEKLRGYFLGLVDAFQITNEVDVTNEEDSAGETRLTLQWTLSLTDTSSQTITRRSAELHARLRLEKAKWKIVEFAPIDLFDPQAPSNR